MPTEVKIAPVMVKATLDSAPSDLAYWLSRPVQERFAAGESLRQAYIQTLPHAQQRFQRVCTITRRAPR
jgi:hypothetical protein